MRTERGIRIYNCGIEYFITKQLPCGHYEGYRRKKNIFIKEPHIAAIRYRTINFNNILNFITMIVITQEQFTEAYKQFPEQRQFLLTLFGEDSLDQHTKQLLEREEQIAELQKKLNDCENKSSESLLK